MNDIIKEIIKSGYTYTGVAMFLIYIFKKNINNGFENIIKMLAKKYGRDTMPIINLEHHPFFTYILESKLRYIPMVRFKSKIKEKLFKEFLTVMFSVFEVGFHKMCDANALQTLSKAELLSMILKTFNVSISEYNKLIIYRYQEMGVSEGDITLMIDKYNEWNEDTIKLLQSGITDAVNSDMFGKNNRLKMVAVLTILKVGFELMITNGVKSFNDLNGQIDSIKLKAYA